MNRKTASCWPVFDQKAIGLTDLEANLPQSPRPHHLEQQDATWQKKRHKVDLGLVCKVFEKFAACTQPEGGFQTVRGTGWPSSVVADLTKIAAPIFNVLASIKHLSKLGREMTLGAKG